jgi:flagellar L-ring protein FlgH
MKHRWILLGVAAFCLSACVQHVAPFKPKVRNYKPDKYAMSEEGQSEGGLWSDGADALFTYRRPGRIGDMVTVLIQEQANATRNAGTDTSRKSEISMGMPILAGLMGALKSAYPGMDSKKLLSAIYKNDFSGKGETKRSGKLTATLTTRIKKVLPNGDLYIEGSKVVMINQEESHLYVSGVVRRSDIQADNTVLSSLLADAQVEYTGRGPLDGASRPGWFSRLLNWLSPF